MFPPTGGDTYEYDVANNRWLAQQAGGASVTVSRDPPANPADGDLWWYCGDDGEDPGLFTYAVDANGVGGWLQSSPGSGGVVIKIVGSSIVMPDRVSVSPFQKRWSVSSPTNRISCVGFVGVAVVLSGLLTKPIYPPRKA